tara:strand:- start:1 stop:231 length:231 start_codon:yes stop_codon:yes gene_type:complete
LFSFSSQKRQFFFFDEKQNQIIGIKDFERKTKKKKKKKKKSWCRDTTNVASGAMTTRAQKGASSVNLSCVFIRLKL